MSQTSPPLFFLRSRLLILTALVLALAACGGDSDSAGSDGADGSTDLGDSDTLDDTGEAEEGGWVAFDWEAPLDEVGHFYDFPWPNDYRRAEDGSPQMQGMALGSRNGLANRLGPALIENVAQLGDFPRISVAWFRFGAPLSARESSDIIPADAAAPLWLVSLDEDIAERERLLPLVAQSMAPDAYTDENVLGLSAVPGIVLRPNTTYAYVVFQDALDADDNPIAIGGNWELLLDGEAPEAIAAIYEPLWPVVESLGRERAEVAAATVFTTGDEVARMADISADVMADYSVEIEGLAIDEDDGADHVRYCELHGYMEMPQFQVGEPPFDSEGRFEFAADGSLVLQRHERVPVVINLPKEQMPEAGFPLVMYIHGSGGLSTQVVDRSPRASADDPVVPGFGPAHVLAGQHMASASAAMPVNPERLPGAGETAYLNLNNLAAFRDTFRQGVIEQRLFASALLDLKLAPEVVTDCEGLVLPEGADEFFFNADPLMLMGQSMGGMYTNMFAAVEDRVDAVVPTGAGGFWSYFILRTNLIPGVANLLSIILDTRAELTWMHPFLHLLQSAWEGAEPMAYVGRISAMPLEGYSARPIFQPAGEGDSYFPTVVYDAMALAYGNPQAGHDVWPTSQPWLELAGLDGIRQLPISDNLTSSTGETYTGAFLQYEGDGFSDPHDIFVQLEEVRHQYACFFRTFLDTGVATIVAPAAEGTPCISVPE